MIHVGNCPRVAAKVTVLCACVCVTLKNLVLHVSVLAVISDNNADDSNRGLNELRVKSTAASVRRLVRMNTPT